MADHFYPLLIKERDVQQLLTMPDTLLSVKMALTSLANGKGTNIPRSRIRLSNGVFHTMAAALPDQGLLGQKTYTAFREGTRFAVMLFNSNDGSLLAIIEADHLGRMRTGAATGVAAEVLARKNAEHLGIIGTGSQAVTQVLGIAAVRTLSSIRVYSRNEEKRKGFCDRLRQQVSAVVISVETAEDAVRNADIVITATTSKEPVIRSEWIQQGTFIAAMGSNWPNRREVDTETILRCSCISVDSKEQAQIEAGDLIIPVQEGKLAWYNVIELGEILIGNHPGRETDSDITFFKSIGLAIEDVAVAGHIYKQALQQNIGEHIDFLTSDV